MQLKADIGTGPPRVHLNYGGGMKMFVARRTESFHAVYTVSQIE